MPRSAASKHYATLPPDVFADAIPYRGSLDSLESLPTPEPISRYPSPHEGLGGDLTPPDDDKPQDEIAKIDLSSKTGEIEAEDYLAARGLVPQEMVYGPEHNMSGDLVGSGDAIPDPVGLAPLNWAQLPFTAAPGSGNRPPGSQHIDTSVGSGPALAVSLSVSEELATQRDRIKTLEARMSAHDTLTYRLEETVASLRAQLEKSETERIELERRITHLNQQTDSGLKAWVRAHFPLGHSSQSTAPTALASTTVVTAAPLGPSASSQVKKRRKDLR